MKTAPFLPAACAALLMLLCGCASTPVEVGDSQLNWISISYRPADAAVKPSRLELIGVGSLEFIEGHSPRVNNDFSQAVDHGQWQDVYQEKLGVPPDVIRGWLQIFVDAGILDRKKQIRKNKEGEARDVAVFRGRINREKVFCATNDEEILGHVRKLIAIVKNGNPRK